MTWPLLLLALAQTTAPIAFTSELHPLSARVGQTIELRLTATWQKTVDRVSPQFDTWVGPFEIVQIDAGVPQIADQQSHQVWVIRLRTFETGRVTIPGIHIEFQQRGTLDRGSAQTNDFVVESVAPSANRDGRVRPMKGIIEPRRDVADYVVVAAALALALLLGACLCIWLVAWYRRASDVETFNSRKALRALQRARERRPADVDAFYSDVSITTRRFLAAAFNIPGPVLSSTEIMSALRETVRPGESLERLSQMLAAVDAVRFGGRIPTDEETTQVLELTRSLLLNRGFLVTAGSPAYADAPLLSAE